MIPEGSIMNKLFKLGATVAMGAPPNSPFPLHTKNYNGSADLLKELGYDTMEIHIRTPALLDGPSVKAHCDAIGIGISSIGTGQAYGMEGLSITSQLGHIRRAAIQRLKDQMDLGKILKCPIIIGSMRGVIGTRTFKEVNGLMVESMKELADYAEQANTEIVVEAIDRFETDYLLTAQEVLGLIDEVGSDRVLVHLDSYHMNLEERDWRKSILSCRNKLGHVHLADNRRYYPGQGIIDFNPILAYLEEIHYDRSLTLECYPYPDGVTALIRGKQYLDGIMAAMSCNSIEAVTQI